MQYALLIYERPHDFDRREDDAEEIAYTGAWQAWHKALLQAGVFVGGSPLEQPDTGTTVRQRDSKRLVQDGPYANTKEQLGGFTHPRAAVARCRIGVGGALPGRLVRCRGSATDRGRSSQACDG